MWRWCLCVLMVFAAMGARAEVVELLRPDALGAWSLELGESARFARGGIAFDDFVRMHLRYDFREGGRSVCAMTALHTDRVLEAVRFRMKKAAAAELTLRVVDRTGQTFEKTFMYDDDDWRTVRVAADDWLRHAGGAEDGVLHQPVRAVGIVVESRGLEEAPGELLIGRVHAELGGSASAHAAEEGIGEVAYQVCDFTSGFSVSGPAVLEDGGLDIDFEAGDAVSLSGSVALYGAPETMTLEVDGGAVGNRVVAVMGTVYQTFTRTLGTLTGDRDTFVAPAPGDDWECSGGACGGPVRLPLRLKELRIERGDGAAARTRIDRMRLHCTAQMPKGNALVLESTLQPGAVGDGLRELTVRAHARYLLSRKADAELRLEVRDWRERLLYHDSQRLVLEDEGAPSHASFTFQIPESLPFAEMIVTADTAGQETAASRSSYTSVPEFAGDATLRPESPWGMGLYLYRYPDTRDGLRIMDEAAALARRAGVKWTREEFSWGRIEPREGEYDFSFYDALVETAARHGIQVYGLLAYWAPWTAPYTEDGIDDFCRWASALAARYQDRITHWEVYNEPNHFFWSGPKKLYAELLDRCYRAIKAANPEAQVLGASTTGIDVAFIQMCLDAGAPFDIVSVHPYRTRMSEGRFMEDLRRLQTQVGERKVWVTEMGWSTSLGGVTEREQATLLARSYLAGVMSGACDQMTWYDFRNDGNDVYDKEFNFGVLYSDLRPKPAYRALATICTALGSGEPVAREDFGPGVFALQMGDGVAVWAREDREVAWRVVEGSPLAMNLMGEVVNPAMDGDVMRVRVRRGAPIVVRGGRIAGVMVEDAEQGLVLEF